MLLLPTLAAIFPATEASWLRTLLRSKFTIDYTAISFSLLNNHTATLQVPGKHFSFTAEREVFSGNSCSLWLGFLYWQVQPKGQNKHIVFAKC